jgi:hypothetical protein
VTTRLFLTIDVPEFETPEALRAYAREFLGLDREPDVVDMVMAVFDGEVSYIPVEQQEGVVGEL